MDMIGKTMDGQGSNRTSLVRQHGHNCGSNPMDRIGETMDGQWLLKIHQKMFFFY